MQCCIEEMDRNFGNAIDRINLGHILLEFIFYANAIDWRRH